ncbi:hypothetical protein GGR54DRAFT_255650 [Hypoxylon sp. NC1633]|nr:hypothetical protein GGR54DRAFT_255650 [Hypoxylon sp. NC1633]
MAGLEVAASIIGIASFGLQFATTLQTYIELVSDAQQSIRDIAFDVSTTAAALKQLYDLIETDHNGKAIVNDRGLQEVIRLASQCEQVYTDIINFLAKAAGVQEDENGEVSQSALQMGMMQKFSWPFREHRIKKRREELSSLKISLLLQLAIVKLAKSKTAAPTGLQIAREVEVAQQATAVNLLTDWKALAKFVIDTRRKRKAMIKAVSSKSSSVTTMEEVQSQRPRSPVIQKSPETATTSALQQSLPFIKEPDKDGPTDISHSDGVGRVDPVTRPSGHPLNVPNVDFHTLMNPTREGTVNFKIEGHSQPTETIGSANPQAAENSVTNEINLKRSIQAGPATEPKSRNPANSPTTPLQSTGNCVGEALSRTIDPPKSPHESKTQRRTVDTFSRLSRIFRRRTPTHDWESKELEAYLIESDSNAVRNLHFSRQELIEILRRTLKPRRDDVWRQYASLSSAQRDGVDKATSEANRSEPCPRTCVAITSDPRSGDDFVVVLFSLGLPLQPIHLAGPELSFKLPFELCRTWEGMESVVKHALAEEGYPPTSRYQLKDLEGFVILPVAWSSTVQPGMGVCLRVISGASWPSIPQSATQSAERLEKAATAIFPAGPPGPSFPVPSPYNALCRKHHCATSPIGNEEWEDEDLEPRKPRKEAGFALCRRGPVVNPVSVAMSHASADVDVEEYDDSDNNDSDEEDEDESEIINFEEELENMNLGVEALLGKWTNAYDVSGRGGEGDA